MDMLDSLRRHHAANGHSYVWPDDADAKRLRRWLAEQRARKAAGTLDAETTAALEALGVDWSAHGAQWEKWERRYLELRAHVATHGNPNISQLVRGLGPWLSAQRVMYRQGVLRDGRRVLLERLGVDWNPQQRLDRRWARKLRELEVYRQKHGHCNVPRKTNPSLGIWVSAQRTARSKGLLSPERCQALEALGFAWSARRGRTAERAGAA
ncbi:hypothetical protein J2T57_001297 [Natronocella acetinitrilica]|uniref:Helicase-associated domain-containing protein n=1 Tax=Natronocella acetinitrilica TaxID=414046 RepID=A0AAE3KAE7_9GAMM|nr:helicase associated domain-containing protein [Natronocella acetinitrilica]MCP1674195.1 hypothetical protein [Natronocella acetinitrilica]